ncbi:MAG: ATP-binding protein [Planctomycetes bacterium]|nr:ATP-binding protein [Planctomycetota bacterium]
MPEFTRRIACGISNPAMDLWICCDEAARLVSSTGAHAMADMIGLVRGTGVGLDFSVQSADVLPAVLSNTANKFIGRCGSATDYDTIGSAMGLSAEQRRTLALSLSPGQFAGQVGEGEWRHPFLFKVPAMNIEEVCAGTSMPSSDGGPINIDSGGIDELMALPIVLVGESVDPQSPPDSIDHPLKETSIGGSHLSDAEIRYLKAVVDHPGQPSNAYTRLAGVGAQRAQTIRKHLVSAGFIREHAVQTRSRGRAAIVLEPLGTAFRTLNERNVRETGVSHEGRIHPQRRPDRGAQVRFLDARYPSWT